MLGLTLKEAAAALGIKPNRMYALDAILKPRYFDRGVNSKMKTRYYDPVIVRAAKDIIERLEVRTPRQLSGKMVYRKRYQTPEEQYQIGLRYFWNTHLHGGKIRDINNHLTLEQFEKLIKCDCHYCGAAPSTRTFGKYKLEVNGIDRVNSDKEYTIRNVVPCCKVCNRMKGVLSRTAFMEHVTRIAEKAAKSSSGHQSPTTSHTILPRSLAL